MSMSVDGAFIYFTIPIFGGIPITQTTVSHLIVTIFLCTVCIVLGKRLTKRPNGVQVMVLGQSFSCALYVLYWEND